MKIEPFDAVAAYRKHPESLKKLKRYCDRVLAEHPEQVARWVREVEEAERAQRHTEAPSVEVK